MLVLRLAPKERVYIDGVLIENLGGRVKLGFLSQARVLRENELVPEDDLTRSNAHLLAYHLGRYAAGLSHKNNTTSLFFRDLIERTSDLVPEEVCKSMEEQIALGYYYNALQQIKSFLE